MDPELMKALIGGGLSAAGGLASGIAQGKMNDKTLAQNQAQFAATQGQQQAMAGLSSTQMDPMVLAKAREQQAFLANVMGNAKKFSTTSSNPLIQEKRRTTTGGLTVPEGGFGEDVMKFYSPEARLASEHNFFSNVQNAAPNSQVPDFSPYGAAGAGAQNSLNQQHQAYQDKAAQDAAATQQAMQKASGGGFWHKLAATVAPIAGYALAPFTAGASIPIGQAIGAWGKGSGIGGIVGAGLGGIAQNVITGLANNKQQQAAAQPQAALQPQSGLQPNLGMGNTNLFQQYQQQQRVGG